MANFTITNSTAIGGGLTQQAVAATYKSLVIIANSTATTANTGAGMLRRGKLYDLLVGTNGTPADNFMEWDVTRATIGTTPAAVTVQISSLSSTFGLDTADPGYVAATAINSSAEGGVTATNEIWYVGVNQRASYRWVAAPGSELVYPAVSSATASNGVSLRTRSGGYTGTATATLLFNEQ